MWGLAVALAGRNPLIHIFIKKKLGWIYHAQIEFFLIIATGLALAKAVGE